MALSIYHNPRCSKSRATLGLIKEANAEHTVILYLDDTPEAAKILEIASNLGLAVAALRGRGRAEFTRATSMTGPRDVRGAHVGGGALARVSGGALPRMFSRP